MIKVSVLYAGGEGKTFDMDYYLTRHMPMIRELCGPACKGISIDQGLGGRAPGSPAPFVAIGHMLFDSLADFQGSFGPHAATIRGDVANYTNIEPLLQISEIKM
jgi:uncharacterized protein (TIGR02118 family)